MYWLSWLHQKIPTFRRYLKKKSNPEKLSQESVNEEAIDPCSILIYITTIGQQWGKKGKEDECVHTCFFFFFF